MTSSSAAMQHHNNNPIIGSSYAREVALPSCILIAAFAIDTLAAWFIDIIEGPLVTAPGFAMFVAVSAVCTSNGSQHIYPQQHPAAGQASCDRARGVADSVSLY
jgi:hypothetical protein